ncbi:MAG: GNAT family N-acetyltransferase [Bacteroidales bacterium]|nr:GNAT family N-acetyltransferase [Bacteroidales bacterium]
MQYPEISCRIASLNDADIITRFQLEMALETEMVQLDEKVTGAGVLAVFGDPSKGTYYIAETNNSIAGCMLTTPEWSDWRNRTILWIQSVYVRPEYRKMGVFTALYDNLKQVLDNNPEIGGIRLYVDKTNHIAQKVYTRLGMNGEHYQVFEWMRS